MNKPIADAFQEKPYPKYLIDFASRAIIETLEQTGVKVVLTSSASGSVSVTATTPDDVTHVEQGRPMDLEQILRSLAELCGVASDDL